MTTAAALVVLPGLTARAAVVPAELVARAGDVPVGAAVALASTQPPFVLSDGGVAFTGLLADGDAYVFVRDQVVWQGSDDPAAMLVGAEASMGATAAGGFAYGPESNLLEAVWTHNGLLALEGTQAPAYPMGYVTTFHSRPTMVENGTVWWLAGLNASGGTTTQQRVLYRSPSASPADVQVEVATGDMLGGLVVASPAGLDFDYHVSNDGSHLVMVVLMNTGSAINDEHVYVDGALFHQENTPNGTGDNWDNFDLVAINDLGMYVFTGDTSGDAGTDEFVALNGAIVVREGDVLDGVTLTTAASLRLVSLDDTGRLVHAWAYAGNTVETVFFACNPADVGGSSRAVLTAGVDELDLDGDGMADALVTDLNTTSTNGSRALADDGSLYLELDIDQGAGPLAAMVRVPLDCCGNGLLDDGEQCDDGNADDTDGCPGSCMPAECGDGFVWLGVEECDDGNGDDSDACLGSCTAATCGDGIVWFGIEACDDGNGDDTDACPGSCAIASCGDGFVWAGNEECDDGNDDDTDGCTAACTLGGATEGSSTDAGSSGPVDASTGLASTGEPTGSSSGSGGQDGSGGTTGATTGEPLPATGSSGEPASTGDTYGPFSGLDDDGGCTCVAAPSRRGGGMLAALSLVLLALGLRRGGRRA